MPTPAELSRSTGRLPKEAFADFLVGRATRLAQASPLDTDHRTLVQGYFIQDTWKLTARVTLSVGLRWEMYPIWLEPVRQDDELCRRGAVHALPERAPGFGVSPATRPSRIATIATTSRPASESPGTFRQRQDGRCGRATASSLNRSPAEMAGGVLIPQPYGLTYNLDAPARPERSVPGRAQPFPLHGGSGEREIRHPRAHPEVAGRRRADSLHHELQLRPAAAGGAERDGGRFLCGQRRPQTARRARVQPGGIPRRRHHRQYQCAPHPGAHVPEHRDAPHRYELPVTTHCRFRSTSASAGA